MSTEQMRAGWLRAIDEAMVVHHIGTAEPDDDYETAKRKLNALLCAVQAIGELHATERSNAAESLLRQALQDAMWCDKYLHPYMAPTYQNWRLEVYLPVPLTEIDKGPEAALRNALSASRP